MRFLVIAIFLLCGCAGTAAVESFSRSETIAIDGELSEWGGLLQAIDKGTLSVGVQNDAENLYLSISTRDPRKINQIMTQGLIVWLDSEGGKAQTLGIRHPIGFTREANSELGLGEGMAANRVRIEQSTSQIEIVGANGHTIRRPKDAVPGMAVQVEADQSVLTYELKVPLVVGEGLLFAIGANPGSSIGIGLTTPENKPDEAPIGGTGGLPGGRMSSADGRGFQGPYPRTTMLPLDEWLSVQLAAP